MSTADLVAITVAAFGAGGLSALAGTLTKYWLDSRKIDVDADAIRDKDRDERIRELERENRECLEKTAAMSRQIGYLEARLDMLENKIKHYRETPPSPADE